MEEYFYRCLCGSYIRMWLARDMVDLVAPTTHRNFVCLHCRCPHSLHNLGIFLMVSKPYTITLEYEGKQYSFLDSFEGWDVHRDADYQAVYMYTEGNYACDCNRARFIGLPDMNCGDTIKLVSIMQGDRELNIGDQ